MNSNKIERRTIPVEVRRLANGSQTMRGRAAIIGSLSEDLGGFREIIHPGAFDRVLANSDVRALLNHDPNKILGRQKAGTLRLSLDPKGLLYELDIPDTTYGRDLKISLDRGDITQSSFAFTIEESDWEQTSKGPIQHIRKVKQLYDVSPVTYPAYQETDARASLRSLQQFKNLAKEQAARRADLLRLYAL